MTDFSRQLIAYAELMRIDKPIGTLLLLWPTWWALWLAGNPTLLMLIIFTLGVFIMRSAGCVINDYADRSFDGRVRRTVLRPFPTGRVTGRGAKILFLSLTFIGFLLVLFLNWLSFLTAIVALLFAMVYPFTKRYTHFPQAILGMAYSMSIPMVYAATTNTLPLSCWLLFSANACWNMAYDTEYAMVDREDDLKVGIKSTAIFFGACDRFAIAVLQMIMLVCLIIIGLLSELSAAYYLGLCSAAALFVFQQKQLSRHIPSECFKAFLNNNYVGGIIWIGILGACYI